MGDPLKYTFSKPQMEGYNYSFSGLKTSILYFLQKEIKKNPRFIDEERDNICASVQHAIIEILFKKLIKASKDLNIRQIAIAGGVSANSGVRNRLIQLQT
jgi:N6-L-threonylcarbamoyladenine synthase